MPTATASGANAHTPRTGQAVARSAVANANGTNRTDQGLSGVRNSMGDAPMSRPSAAKLLGRLTRQVPASGPSAAPYKPRNGTDTSIATTLTMPSAIDVTAIRRSLPKQNSV